MSYIGRSPQLGVRTRFYYTATGGETSLSGADDNGNTLVFSDGTYVDVLLNGITLVAGVDYNTSTANTISGLAALTAADVAEIVVYDVFSVGDAVSKSNGGTFDGVVNFDAGANGEIGGTTPAAGTFTTLTAASLAYPTSDGTAGQVLSTDGSGTLSFTSVASDAISEGDSSVEVIDTGTGRIEFTTDGTKVAEIDASGNMKFDSGYGSAETVYGCRAWVFFDGEGTVAIRESGNVSSITDSGAGLYTVNLANAMPDTNFTALVTGTCGGTSSGYAQLDSTGFNGAGTQDQQVSTSAFNIRSVHGGTGTATDHPMVCAAVFR